MKIKNRTIDLFAGIGGIRMGFEKAGFKTVFSSDYDKYCKETFDLNFRSPNLTLADIRELESSKIPEFDFLLAGFPCQPFSVAGYREGFDDKKGRGNLFFEIARILEDTNVEGFFLENVRHLKTHDKGKTFRIISETLNELGYYFKYKILNSLEYGRVPQIRERIYMVGFRTKKFIDDFSFPRPYPLNCNFKELLESNVDQKYYYNGKPLSDKLKDFEIGYDTVYQWRRVYLRENKKGVCPTLTANMGTGGHNVPIIRDESGIRKLTPRECARLQGFPESYKLSKNISESRLYKQIGNSVTVTVVEAVANKMFDAMAGRIEEPIQQILM